MPRKQIKTADDDPHVQLPDGSVFDLCIERLGLERNHQDHPLNAGKWFGDEASWIEWRQWLANQYAGGNTDLFKDKAVRNQVRSQLSSASELPYFDHATRQIKMLPKQPKSSAVRDWIKKNTKLGGEKGDK